MYTPRKIKVLSNVNESINLDKHWELVNFCEFDKYATKSYCAIHNVDESLNLGDITKVDETKLADFNMMTWGFPCTDISVAGKQKGFLDEDGNKTRSGMYYEGIRILRYKKPALSIIENVKNLTGKKFKKEFDMVLSDLDEAGYNSYYKVLNAKNYGIPQNRERVFIISIRKDLDNGQFKFPEPFDNGIRLKDILEDEVDEKFYLSDDKVQKFLSNFNQSELPVTTRNSDTVSTIRATYYKNGERNVCENIENGNGYEGVVESNNVKQIGNISEGNSSWGNPQTGRIYSVEGICPTLNTCGGGQREPKIITGLVSSKGEKADGCNLIEYINCIIGCLDLMSLFGGNVDEERYKTIRKILYVLWKEIRKEKIQWKARGLWRIQKKKVLRPGLHDQISPFTTESRCDLENCSSNSAENQSENLETVQLRNMWEDWQTRCSSYKLELERQFLEEFTGFMSELSQQDSQNQRCMLDMWETDERVRLLQQALLALQEIWMSFNDEEKQKMSNVSSHNRRSDEMCKIRIRKLTPKETWRLMGFSDHDFDAAKNVGISNSQLYKQAGNSIVVDVLYYIYVELYKAMPYLFDDLKLSSFFSGIGAFESSLDLLYQRIINFDRSELNIKNCEICGSDLRVKHNKTTNMYLCEKHCKQIYAYGKITNSSSYNQNDKNEIRTYEDYAILVLKNKYGEIVGESIVDIDDVDIISQYKWSLGNHGYVTSGAGKNQILLHRLLSHAPDDVYVDHINRNKLDNRKSNYRFCTNQENNRNKGLYSHNTSGITGVTWNKERNKWQAQIVVNNQNINLGRFLSFGDAVKARLRAEEKYFKDFTPQNRSGLYEGINSGNFINPQVE